MSALRIKVIEVMEFTSGLYSDRKSAVADGSSKIQSCYIYKVLRGPTLYLSIRVIEVMKFWGLLSGFQTIVGLMSVNGHSNSRPTDIRLKVLLIFCMETNIILYLLDLELNLQGLYVKPIIFWKTTQPVLSFKHS